ncbi:hypothetical protein OG559_17800 [Micromonospora sp. NBC_01405]
MGPMIPPLRVPRNGVATRVLRGRVGQFRTLGEGLRGNGGWR